MIKEYYRPKTINETVELLQQNQLAIPIGGGTSLQKLDKDILVVDLQDLSLNYIKKVEKKFNIGSTTTLENIKEYFSGNEIIKRVLQIEGSKNQRTQSSLGGFLKSAGGRSPLLTCLMTLNCTIFFAKDEKGMSLSEFLDVRRTSKNLITYISVNDPDNLNFESVSRSPFDLPIVCCAVASVNDGLNASVGGFGEKPQILPEKYFIDKNEDDIAAYITFSTDDWGSADYRAHITPILLKRLIFLTKKGNQ